MSEKKYSKGAALALAGLFGPLGVDKFYVGLPEIGLIQIILSVSIIGLVISLPWSAICILGLVLSILFGTGTFLYPGVEWEETTSNDQIIAWVVVGIYIFGLLISMISAGMNTSTANTLIVQASEAYNRAPTPSAPLPSRSGTLI